MPINNIGASTPGISQRSFESNIQHVGGQRQVSKPQSEVQDDTSVGMQAAADSVSFTQDAAENATHMGMVQGAADEADDANGISGEDSAVVGDNTSVSDAAAPADSDSSETGAIDGDSGYPVDPSEDGYIAGGNIPGGPGGPAGPSGPTNASGSDENDGYDNSASQTPPKSEAERAREYQKMQQEQQEYWTIMNQIMADRQKWMAELMKILQDTQTEMFKIMEDAMLNKAQAFDRCNHMWDDVIKGRG